ncbi:hypothetical protein Vadar_016185 [Vaccinium darrowii]|uniref:Uncharacterized protein n=1 Tax=Vaccinium darrowii TaxID=229202 RepID=A0ACB7Y6Y0_9ERIC|nr:hypothetical protein Vadar_016185 [Vaccinium darrowii]
MDELFTVVIHHQGHFLENPIRYVEGFVNHVDDCDPEKWSKLEVEDIVERLGYPKYKLLWYRILGLGLDEGLRVIGTDKDAVNMTTVVKGHEQIEVYVEHIVDEVAKHIKHLVGKMDKSWIDLPTQVSMEYLKGIDEFIEFAYSSRPEGSFISCPCRRCENRYSFSRQVVKDHLYSHGFFKNYKNWTNHGEPYSPLHCDGDNGKDKANGDDMVGMIYEALGNPQLGTENNEQSTDDPQTGPDERTMKYLKLLQDAQIELYPGCKNFTTLSFVVRLLHMKVLYRWANESVDALFELFHQSYPEGVKLPNSHSQAVKVTKDLSFKYETWDACPNNCMLFRKENAKLDACTICNVSRWKPNDGEGHVKQKAAKQMRYFPLKPTLQRWFMSTEISEQMRWHADGRTNDGVSRHPADSPAWKDFDQRHKSFSNESQNVRLGLASDGFNPFGSAHIAHSTWPVVLIPYNLPPWMCMKQPFFILSVLIDGPKGPGDKIDVYLQPLIEELLELWNEGVPTFDASTNQMFQLRAALLWTINDFPAFANLSGWSTKGEYACPVCNKNTVSCWLKYGRKHAYMGHRRFLPNGHKFRKDKVSFDGKRELRDKPRLLSGTELLNQLDSEGILTQ